MTLTTEQKTILIDTCNVMINREATSGHSENLREVAKIALSTLTANREAQPVAYFAAAPDYGWDMFKNKEDAIATCQAEIDAYRDCRDDGWDDDVQRVCWGVVMQKAEGFDLQGLHTSNSNHTYQTCDYSLHPVTATAPPAPAVNMAPDFEAWFNSPEAGLRVVNFHIQHELQLKAWNACRAAMLENIDKPAPQLDSVVTRHADQSVSSGYKLVPVEPTDEQLRAMLAVIWPATYREYLRHPDNGPKSSQKTEGDIKTATAQYAAMLEAAPEGGN
ncbi:TPA: hypothetical protein ACIR5X_000162 [Serratia marcescens]